MWCVAESIPYHTMYPYEELHQLRASGQVERAYIRGSELLARHADDPQLRLEHGWVLYDRAKQIINESGNPDSISELLQEFDRLNVRKPNQLFSKLVKQCLLLDPLPGMLPEFLMSAGLDAYRREDYVAPVSQASKKRLPSLVEKAAAAMGRLLSESEAFSQQVQQFALEFVEMTLDRAQVRDFHVLRYHKALILGRLGKIIQACETMKWVVKTKIDEHWSWQALARLEAARDISRALDLSVRAYLLCDREQYVVQLLSDIRIMSESIEDYEMARWAGDKEFDIRLKNGWKIFPPLADIESFQWYRTAKEIANLDERLADMAASAEKQLFAGGWVDGNIIGTFESKAGTHLLKVWLAEGHNELVSPVAISPELSAKPVGTPVQAIVHDMGRYPKLLRLRLRPDGELYDYLLDLYGVVDHQNPPRELVSVYITPHEYCLLPYNKFSGVSDLAPGTPLRIRCSRWKDRLFAYSVTKSNWSESEWIMRFNGPMRRHSRGFAFVGEVFIPPPLIPPDPDHEYVSGICIKKPKWKGSAELGWTALSLMPEQAVEEHKTQD